MNSRSVLLGTPLDTLHRSILLDTVVVVVVEGAVKEVVSTQS